MSSRSQKVVMSDEARVLKLLRAENGLSLKAVASSLEVSDSLISQIENGRIDPPRGAKLERFLKVYGDIKPKSFQERVRRFQATKTDKGEALELIARMNDSQLGLILPVIRSILKT